jgi:hypothetical protein
MTFTIPLTNPQYNSLQKTNLMGSFWITLINFILYTACAGRGMSNRLHVLMPPPKRSWLHNYIGAQRYLGKVSDTEAMKWIANTVLKDLLSIGLLHHG